MFVWLLIGSFCLLMCVSVQLPFGIAHDGHPIKHLSLTVWERLQFRRRNLFCFGIILLLSALGHWFTTPLEVGLILLGLCINILPTRYSWTTAGIACNNTLFRYWHEFSSVQVKGAQLIFNPHPGSAPLRLAILPSRQKDILPLLERFLTVSRQDCSAPCHPLLSWLRRHLHRQTLQAMLFSLLFMLLAGTLFSACGEAGQDPSGLNTASQQNLTHIAVNGNNSTVTSNALSKAKTQEPFAYSLAVLVDENRLGINFVWTLITGYMVMFMQLGFLLVEVGFCRAKNAAHTAAMNIMVYGISILGYFCAGFAFQFGGVGLIGVPNLGGLAGLNNELSIHIGNVNWGLLGLKGFLFNDGSYDVGIAVMFLFQLVFMNTAATIPTGALAERWKWSAFCIYVLFFSTLVYPVFGNWAWGGGWLSQLSNVGLGAGYVDFAGSGVVHAVGGWCALAGAMVLGPRLGKYNSDGSSNTIPGHNMVFAVVGSLILAFGWFGFNPGSTLGASGNGDLRMGLIAVNTMLSGAAGSIVAMIYTWLVGTRKPDLGMMCNGLLAGLVAITAPSGYISPLASLAVGAIAGFNVVFFMGLIEKVWKIDDPVGAIAVHGVNGMWGQLAVGFFADGTSNYGGLQVRGLFFGDFGQLLAQVIGAVTCFLYVFGVSWLFFKAYHGLFGMRVSSQVELAGLDVPELGGLAYPPDVEAHPQPATAPIADALPVAAWQQAQLDQNNQRPLPQALRIRPAQPNYQERPVNPNYQERLVNPSSRDEGRHYPTSESGGNGQPEAWWQNQRNRPRRVSLGSDGEPGIPG